MASLISPVWAATGDKATGDDFNDTRKNQGFIAEQCSYQLMNAVIDRDETKINEICTEINTYLPTSDQKDAMDGASSPNSGNVFMTADDVTTLPTSDQKDAMDGASSPDSGNVFMTADDVYHGYLNRDKYIFVEHFDELMAVDYPQSGYLSNKWLYSFDDKTGSGGGFNVGTDFCGQLSLTTADATDATRTITGINTHDTKVSLYPKMSATCLLSNTTSVFVRFGLYYDDNNFIAFVADTASSSYWRRATKDTGSITIANTSVALDAGWHNFKIDVESSSSVKFYIDGSSEGEHTTNIPHISTQLTRYARIITLTNISRYLKFDNYQLICDAPSY